jgi:hypothetical protein
MSLFRKNILLFIATALIASFSFILTLTFIPNHLVFGFDQARDAYESHSIYNKHDLKILGPSSDVPGLNHGVMWYYYLALAYGLTGGSPENAAIFTTCLFYLFLLAIGVISYKMTKNIKIALTCISLYSLAPLYIAFTYWLSNPTLSLLITPLLVFAIWRYIEKQNTFLSLLIGLGYGLLMQSDFAFVVLLLTIPLFIYFFKLKTRIKNLIFLCLGFLIGIAPLLITYIKFKTNILQIVMSFLVNNTGYEFSTSQSLNQLLDKIINILSMTFLPLPKLVVFLIFLFFIFRSKAILNFNNKLIKLLFVWLSGVIFVFIFNRGSMSANFLFAPFLFPTILLISFTIFTFIKKPLMNYAIIFIIILFQFFLNQSWSKTNISYLSVQQGMTINYEKDVVDYTYANAKGEPFIINTITNPLFINTTWAYLYEFYGQKKYHYLPRWDGKDQAGYLGNLPLGNTKNISLRYLIIEPKEGISDIWIMKGTFIEDQLSDIVEEKKFGKFIVQKRKYNSTKGIVIPPEELQKREDVLWDAL